MATAGDLITGALRLIGQLAEGEAASAETANDALVAMNQMLDSWSAERLSIFSMQDQVFAWPANTVSRTLGPTGDFIGKRPVLLDASTYFRDPSTDISSVISIVNQEQYNGIALKTTTAPYPQVLRVDMDVPNVQMFLYPVPSRLLEWHFISVDELVQPATLATVLSVPPGYLRAFRFNLAVEIATEFGIEPPANVARIAMSAKRTLKRINNPRDILGLPSTLGSEQRFSTFTGGGGGGGGGGGTPAGTGFRRVTAGTEDPIAVYPTKVDVGLINVDNTSDAAKPVSTAQQAALDLKASLTALAASGGSALVGHLQAGTGATSRTVREKLRDIINVKDFGAVGNGTADDHAAITAAIAAHPGATIFFPPGSYRTSAEIVVTGGVLLLGSGLGKYPNDATCKIIGDLAVTPIVTINGSTGSQTCGVKALSIGRVAGVVPTGSVGLLITSSDGPVAEDVFVYRCAVAFKVTGQLGIHLLRCATSIISETHLWLENTYELHAIDCRFGANGGLDIACNEFVRIKTGGDTLKFTQCQFNLSAGLAARGIYFDTYTSPNGIFEFAQCHFERLTNFIAVVATPQIWRLSVINTAINSETGSQFGIVPAATFIDLAVLGCPFIVASLTLDQCTRSRVAGNFLLNNVVINAGSGVFSNNILNANLTAQGTCSGYTVSGNVLSAATSFTNTATGLYGACNNVINDAALNAAVVNSFPGHMTVAGTLSASVIRTSGYTVAALPAGTVGQRAYVTDAAAPTFLGALTGGGTVHTPVFRNATVWVAG